MNEKDNVLICSQPVSVGYLIDDGERSLRAKNNIQIGHKIARFSIAQGESVIRYGVSIGSATCDINEGEHVHIHNMKSDYIPSHTRQQKIGG